MLNSTSSGPASTGQTHHNDMPSVSVGCGEVASADQTRANPMISLGMDECRLPYRDLIILPEPRKCKHQQQDAMLPILLIDSGACHESPAITDSSLAVHTTFVMLSLLCRRGVSWDCMGRYRLQGI